MNKWLQSIKCKLGFHSYNDVFGTGKDMLNCKGCGGIKYPQPDTPNAFEYKPSPKFDVSNDKLVLSDLDILHRITIFRRDMALCQSVEDQTVVYIRCITWFNNQGYSEKVVKQIRHILDGM